MALPNSSVDKGGFKQNTAPAGSLQDYSQASQDFNRKINPAYYANLDKGIDPWTIPAEAPTEQQSFDMPNYGMPPAGSGGQQDPNMTTAFQNLMGKAQK